MKTNSNEIQKVGFVKQMANILQFEKIFKIMFIILFSQLILCSLIYIIGVVATFVSKAIEFQSYKKTKQLFSATYLDLIALLVIICFHLIIEKLFSKLTYNIVYRNLYYKIQGEERVQKTFYTQRQIYNMIIHFINFVNGAIYLFYDEPWMPTYFGGNDDCNKVYLNYPDWPEGSESRIRMKNYYIFQFGYHFGEFLSLVFLKNKAENTKFWEYTLHHFVAVALISVSLSYNLVIIGIIVLMCHDPADIVIGYARAYYEYNKQNKIFIVIYFSMMLIVWCWSRLYIYPLCVVKNSFLIIQTEEWDMFATAYIYCIVLLFVLLLQHIYWTLYLLKRFVSLATQKKHKSVKEGEKEKNQ